MINAGAVTRCSRARRPFSGIGHTNLPVQPRAHTMPAIRFTATAGSDGGVNIALAAPQPGSLNSSAGSWDGGVVIQFVIGSSGRHRPSGAQSTTLANRVGKYEASSAASIPPKEDPKTTGARKSNFEMVSS